MRWKTGKDGVERLFVGWVVEGVERGGYIGSMAIWYLRSLCVLQMRDLLCDLLKLEMYD